ncbi:FAD-binding monooxygenase [Kitasatospora acidiphila]|uniref:FAD-binding monooxygenase n=1 Tax=Kitasatospora acidiphila TaxID=2567942 RepID=A0A540VYF2_9ACTN|nr:FAD-dependent monooxygenase [Kitasatospora acidiphila]TQF01775.1 FAD-binding monooxygenase [Kitasatospora acidiphila]
MRDAQQSLPSETEVLIVGAGPVGLALALELRFQGVDFVLIDAGDGTVPHPKVSAVGPRAMEHFRRWGLADRIREAGWPTDHSLDTAWVTRVGGHEVHRLRVGTTATRAPFRHTPEPEAICPQHWLTPLLADALGHHPGGPLLLRHRLEGLQQANDSVTAKVNDRARHATATIQARYLVAADGADSAVRAAIGITAPARYPTQVLRNILFEAPELRARLGERHALFYYLLLSDALRFPLRAVDGQGMFRLSIRCGGTPEAAQPAMALLRRAIAVPTPLRVLSDQYWRLTHRLATEFRSGRVFLLGDAAHTLSPSGGFGANAGIAAAANLGWKLAAELAGWAGPALLDSYQAERRPVALEALDEAHRNLRRTIDRTLPAELYEDGPVGAAVRADLAARLEAEGARREFDAPMIHMGYRYASQIVLPEEELVGGAAALADEPVDRPNSRPGSRAPHAWLAPGRSTLDLFGPGFRLLAFDPQAADPGPLERACRARRVPLAVTVCRDAAVAGCYRAPLVLVRPDGHVAWRGGWTDAPRGAGADAVVDTARGAGEGEGDGEP